MCRIYSFLNLWFNLWLPSSPSGADIPVVARGLWNAQPSSRKKCQSVREKKSDWNSRKVKRISLNEGNDFEVKHVFGKDTFFLNRLSRVFDLMRFLNPQKNYILFIYYFKNIKLKYNPVFVSFLPCLEASFIRFYFPKAKKKNN